MRHRRSSARYFSIAAVVLTLEVMNSAIESFLDKLYPEFDDEVGFIKDYMAGAVLIASMVALVVFVIYVLSSQYSEIKRFDSITINSNFSLNPLDFYCRILY